MKTWGRRLRLPFFLFFVITASSQDQHNLASPNGKVEFHLYVSQNQDGSLPRLAYQVFYQGKRIIEPSFLGFDILDQEPLLGENDGLTKWSSQRGSMTAEYMQNGSIGRRINIEVRAWNDGVAFRYVIPRTAPLQDLQIADELTEFALATKHAEPVTEVPGAGWAAIGEQGGERGYPPLKLISEDNSILITHLAKTWESTTPLTTPWRVIGLGPTRDAALANQRNFKP